MRLLKCLLTANRCFKKNQKMKNNRPTGMVVHSTGSNNAYIKRYVQPLKTDSDYSSLIEELGVNKYNNHWNKSTGSKCVHAFIGRVADKTVKTCQTLPFDVCCWGVGKGSKGSYNYNPRARVQFEICEDSLKDEVYFNEVMKEAQEFCAYICKMYDLSVSTISSHKESHAAGYGSNHADIDHWLVKFGKNMDWFRSEVQRLLDQGIELEEKKEDVKVNEDTIINNGTIINVPTPSSKELIFEWLKKNTGMTTAAICGILANIHYESSFRSNNLQRSYEKKLDMTDLSYTTSVDNGEYTNFVRDRAGYGLCQWTYWSRKQRLLEYANEKKVSIGDYVMQLEFMLKELQTYKALWDSCFNDPDTEETAYDIGHRFCYYYERPAAKETSSVTRGDQAKVYFNEFKSNEDVEPPEVSSKFPYRVKVTSSALNYRRGPGMNYGLRGTIKDKGVYTIVDEVDGWGLLKTYKAGRNGWINLKYTKKL